MRFVSFFAAVLLMGCQQLPPGEFPNAGSDEPEEADAYDDTDPAALQDFRTALDPHGAWVEDATYGTVWVPKPEVVGADFTPYVTAGHWTYDDEWVWVSDWDWGWAPFHYGRWVFVDGRGWVWVPGRRYSGAWVVWQYDGAGYLGWAAAPPYWYWRSGVATRISFGVGLRYVYVGRGDVFGVGIHQRVFWGDRAVGIRGGMRDIANPTPQSMGHAVGSIPRSGGNAGMMRAQQMGRPSSAVGVGGHAPTGGMGHAVPSRGFGGGGMGHAVPSGGGMGGGMGHAVPSRGFGGGGMGGGGGGRVGGRR